MYKDIIKNQQIEVLYCTPPHPPHELFEDLRDVRDKRKPEWRIGVREYVLVSHRVVRSLFLNLLYFIQRVAYS
eukprot:CCRYP_017516-RB/>CCRYP_017516-RB protein AED:0.42 eAED:0.77 QI:55/0/0.33/1/0/0/3/0/72